MPVPIEGGVVYELSGLRVAGIGGLILKAKRARRGVPRKALGELLEVARRLRELCKYPAHTRNTAPLRGVTVYIRDFNLRDSTGGGQAR